MSNGQGKKRLAGLALLLAAWWAFDVSGTGSVSDLSFAGQSHLVPSNASAAEVQVAHAPRTAFAQGAIRQWRIGKSANGSLYVGEQSCVPCHSEIARRYTGSSMVRALAKADTKQLKLPLAFKLGAYEYKLEQQGEQVQYTITNGVETLSVPLLWTFGHGASGHTFVLEHEGKRYESRVSYFTNLQRLDLTPGAPEGEPASMAAAIGQPLPDELAQACFTCHSTPAAGSQAVSLNQVNPNLHCEACHGAGEKHVAQMRAGKAAQADKAIFNPKSLYPDDLNQQFCGACHRSWTTVMSMPGRGGLANVRFQPYRLANSKCYQNPDDRRISCIACHDPHGALVKETIAYDTKCLACHQGGSVAVKTLAKQRTAPACRTGKQDCASCHMAKVEPAGLHFKFTDHFIRIVKAGAPVPK